MDIVKAFVRLEVSVFAPVLKNENKFLRMGFSNKKGCLERSQGKAAYHTMKGCKNEIVLVEGSRKFCCVELENLSTKIRFFQLNFIYKQMQQN